MTPEERQLIAGLFDRMRGFTLTSKDAEAEALINDQVRSLRDAPYMLVQSVLVQEQALQTAESRIKQLEEQVAALQSEAQSRPSSGSGSFLGGFLGGRSEPEPARSTSVPPIGSRAAPAPDGGRPGWGGTPTAPTAPQPAGGGGFLQSALSTAAGVAGGMLAAGAISSLLGGGQSAQAASTAGAAQQPQNAADAGSGQKPEEPVHEASYNDDDDDDDDGDDDGGWFGGDDGGSFDI